MKTLHLADLASLQLCGWSGVVDSKAFGQSSLSQRLKDAAKTF